jgi:flagellar biosynthesis protein FliR
MQQLADCSPFAVAVMCVRTLGVTISLPLGDALGVLSKLMVAVGISLAIVSFVPVPETITLWILLGEFVLGLLVGAPFRVLVDLAETLGELIDTARGQTIAAVNDPLNGHAVSDLATLAKIAATAVAINLGALEVCVESLRESYRAVPIGAVIDFDLLSRGLLLRGSELLSSMLVTCALWLVAFLLIDVIACFAARVSQGLSFSCFGSLLKMIVTCVLLGVVVVSSERGGRGWLTLCGVLSGGAAKPMLPRT